MIFVFSLLLVAGFIILIKGADFFVSGASSLGLKLKIPQIVIGLSVVALGTSMPELFVNIIASVANKNDIVLGNIVGSNIFNILLILGVSAVIYPVFAPKNTVMREIPFVIIVAVILLILGSDFLFGENYAVISRGDGIVLLVFMGFFVFYLFELARTSVIEELHLKEMKLSRILIFMSIGMVGLVAGGNMIVFSSSEIARFLGISEKVIAITIISAGTGLPELVTSCVASFKKNPGIAIGNIVGSNIFNIVLVLGICALINPLTSAEGYIFDYAVLILSSFLLLLVMFIVKKSTITRIEGIVMIALYIAYISYTVIAR